MRRITLDMWGQERYEVIKELVDHQGNKNRAVYRLRLSIRHINRLIDRYKKEGKAAFVHGNLGRVPVNKKLHIDQKKITELYAKEFEECESFQHFREQLEQEFKIKVSYTYLYGLLSKAGFISNKAKRATKRAAKKREIMKRKENRDKDDKTIEMIVTHEMAIKDAHPRQVKPKYFGEIVEQDGSIHHWFGKKRSCLHLALDKTTNLILGAWFAEEETLNGYYHVLYQILRDHGIPARFVTDNRTVFNYNLLDPSKRTSEKDVLTQYGYACKQLGIDLKTTSVSQKKGQIERANQTIQGRLVFELKHHNITTMEEANEYLLNTFVPDFNKRFGRNPKNFPSLFEKAPSEEKINCILAVLTGRTIDGGNSIRFRNKYYQPYLDDHLKCFRKGTKCLVIEAYDGNTYVTVDDQVCELRELPTHARYSKDFDPAPKEPPKAKRKYIPPMNHPWRLSAFKAQVEKAHRQHIYA